MTGQCEHGPGCPVRPTQAQDHIRGITKRHTENSDGSNPDLPITMEDEPMLFSEFVCSVVWWVGTAALVVLAVAAIGLATGMVQIFFN
jgi:hypothetical protein